MKHLNEASPFNFHKNISKKRKNKILEHFNIMGHPKFSHKTNKTEKDGNLAKRFSGESAFGFESFESGMVIISSSRGSSATFSFSTNYVWSSPPYAGGDIMSRFAVAVKQCGVRCWRERLKRA